MDGLAGPRSSRGGRPRRVAGTSRRASPRGGVLGRYSMVTTPDEIVDTYTPVVTEVEADIVTIQI